MYLQVCVAQWEHGSQRTTFRDGFLLSPADAGSTWPFPLLSVLQSNRSESSRETLTSTDCFPAGVLESQMRATTSVFHGFWRWNPNHPCVASEASCELTENLWETQKRGNGLNFMVIAQSWHQNPKEEYIKIKSEANLNHEHECKSESKNPLQMLIKLDTGH